MAAASGSSAGGRPPGLLALLRAAGASFVGIAVTRAELALLELEELRDLWMRWLAFTLMASLLMFLALITLTMLIVVLLWDSYRIEALAVFTLIYGAAATYLGMRVLGQIRSAAPMMSATLAELAKDRAALQPQAPDKADEL